MTEGQFTAYLIVGLMVLFFVGWGVSIVYTFVQRNWRARKWLAQKYCSKCGCEMKTVSKWVTTTTWDTQTGKGVGRLRDRRVCPSDIDCDWGHDWGWVSGSYPREVPNPACSEEKR